MSKQCIVIDYPHAGFGWTALVAHDAMGDHWVRASIYGVVAREINGDPLYWIKGYTGSGDLTGSTDDAEVFATALIKWDGTCNVWFAEQMERGSEIDTFGPPELDEFGKFLKDIYIRAFDLMPDSKENITMWISKEALAV